MFEHSCVGTSEMIFITIKILQISEWTFTLLPGHVLAVLGLQFSAGLSRNLYNSDSPLTSQSSALLPLHRSLGTISQ